MFFVHSTKDMNHLLFSMQTADLDDYPMAMASGRIVVIGYSKERQMSFLLPGIKSKSIYIRWLDSRTGFKDKIGLLSYYPYDKVVSYILKIISRQSENPHL